MTLHPRNSGGCPRCRRQEPRHLPRGRAIGRRRRAHDVECGLLRLTLLSNRIARGEAMTVTYKTIGATVLSGAVLMTPASLRGQAAEVFTATAAVKGAGGAVSERAGDHHDRPQDDAKRGGVVDGRVQGRRRGRVAEGARGDSPHWHGSDWRRQRHADALHDRAPHRPTGGF